MGTSTDAYLGFGFDLGENEELQKPVVSSCD